MDNYCDAVSSEKIKYGLIYLKLATMPAGMNLEVAKNRCPITQVRVKATAAMHSIGCQSNKPTANRS